MSVNDFTTVKIAGPAGAGIKSSGIVLSNILLAHNQKIRDYSEYPSLVRGGHNTYQVTFSSSEVFSVHQKIDIFFSLIPGHWQQHQSEFKTDSVIFSDESSVPKISKGKFNTLPLKQLSSTLGKPIYANTICLGVLIFLLGFDKEISKDVVKKTFGSTSPNNDAFDLGYDYAVNNFFKLQRSVKHSISKRPQKYYDGNEAYGWGFIKGGGNFYAAYPMTPATGALHFLAAKSKDHNLVVVHPEDEISAANMAAGAAFAGARAATGTSGGGFALMNEAVSFCGIAELGMVYYLVSRPGPATGLPTWTSQGDLMHAIYSGHGEFPKVVIAPGDHQESFEMGGESLNLAAQLQTPVLVLSDKLLGESGASVSDLSLQKIKINSGKIIEKPDLNFKRYSLKVKDGVSSLTLPGTKNGEFLSNSYEHDELGYSTEDAILADQMNQKRLSKIKTAIKLAPKAEIFASEKAKKIIIGWGSTKGAILETLKMLPNREDYCFMQIKTLWPINPDLEKMISCFEEIIVIENNSTAQLVTLLKSQFNFNPTKIILKSDGRPFFPEELYDKLK
ncbi:MAG: 2-oxoacid:acceptor oxidoreductase subunit alpha [Candidatus Moranbacteria bacterium]|nr:2-oxoacid:acceptor oxidoreductase subunit alpha [Candidatus Moranbacteria bacterium]